MHTIYLVSLCALTSAWFPPTTLPLTQTVAAPPPVIVATPEHPADSANALAPLSPPPDADVVGVPAEETPEPSAPDLGGLAQPHSPEHHPHFWVRAESLVWWIKAAPVSVPLVTTSANPNDLGVLNQPSTSVLFGNQNVNQGTFPGMRITAGYQLSPIVGLEFSGFMLAQAGRGFSTSSDATGNPLLAVPFLTPFSLVEQAQIIASSGGASSGGIVVDQHSHLWSTEFNVTALVYRNKTWWLNLVGGFRYTDLGEGLGLNTTSTLLINRALFNGAVSDPGSTISARDSFRTHNQFAGGQFGLEGELSLGRFFLNARAMLALGNSREILDISGSSFALPPGQTAGTPAVTALGGLLAVSSNIGHYSDRSKFAVLPEMRATVGYRLTESMSLFAGYNYLYWSNVIRPGEQIDRRVNINLVPAFANGPNSGTGLSQPAVSLRSTDFFAHGLNVGIGLNY